MKFSQKKYESKLKVSSRAWFMRKAIVNKPET